MSYVNLTQCERTALLEGILESDKNYLNELIKRKIDLMLEFELLEHSIYKKMIEIENMQAQLDLIDTYH